jgi:hypothetical protein
MRGELTADHRDRLVLQHKLARAYWRDKRFAEADKLMNLCSGKEAARSARRSSGEPFMSERVLAGTRKDPDNPAVVFIDLTAPAMQSHDRDDATGTSGGT